MVRFCSKALPVVPMRTLLSSISARTAPVVVAKMCWATTNPQARIGGTVGLEQADTATERDP